MTEKSKPVFAFNDRGTARRTMPPRPPATGRPPRPEEAIDAARRHRAARESAAKA